MTECKRQNNECKWCPAFNITMRRIKMGLLWQDAVTAGYQRCSNFDPQIDYKIDESSCSVQEVKVKGRTVFSRNSEVK